MAALLARVKLTNLIIDIRARERTNTVTVPVNVRDQVIPEPDLESDEPLGKKRKRQPLQRRLENTLPYGQDNDRRTPAMMVSEYMNEPFV